MHISIWQQFGSNHSASFTVVGEFKDANTASVAAETLRDVAKSIVDWYSANEEARIAVIERTQESPTPAELHVCNDYEISCEKAIDWLANCGYSEDIVAVYDNYAFVTNRSYLLCGGWAGEALFDQLMAKLAVRAFVEEENSRALVVTITCTAPDVEVAKSIESTAGIYLVHDDVVSYRDIPWIGTFLRNRPAGQEILNDYQTYLKRRQAERQWDVNHKGDLRQLYEQAGVPFPAWPPSTEASRIQQEFQKAKERDLADIEDLAFQRQLPVQLAMAAVSGRIPWWAKGGVEREDRELSLRGIMLSKIPSGLPTVVEWLTEQGCTDIRYDFEQH
jgi:hypothetical protein